MFLTGCLSAPAYIVAYTSVTEVAPAARQAEARTWITTSWNLALAGAALARRGRWRSPRNALRRGHPPELAVSQSANGIP
jgi:hypothetical protein